METTGSGQLSVISNLYIHIPPHRNASFFSFFDLLFIAFTMKLFCENGYRLLAVNYFREKPPSQISDWVLNMPLKNFTLEII